MLTIGTSASNNEIRQSAVTKTPSRNTWIYGSTYVENFDDIYDLDDIIGSNKVFYINDRGPHTEVYKCKLKNRETIRTVKLYQKNVVLRDILETPTHFYFVGDYIDGINLIEKIIRSDVYTEYDLSKYCKQILIALQYIHNKNLYHGNLKAENILIHDEQLCLTDYTYANLFQRNALSQLVNVSPRYCAPELLRGEEFTSCSDMWSLGILLFYCLTGTYPFGSTHKQIFHNILKEKIDYTILEWNHVSENGQNFVARLLKFLPKDRMTVNQALQHPWIREKIYKSTNLQEAQRKITEIRNDTQ
ncbi:unnamed protein product [Didymodactylos carnosus]|uniref:Protein kinase domain-containing protein n=1 Tax=Didymodactylos carnosus TaxID=1234261 RepID=A0A814D924_9BILA|nr:unnamed protein product [Didymodactylos carnosus]CAF3726771.1 unnamed protein product [Didymodactylos carnosus]